jgi:hypothetical protein
MMSAYGLAGVVSSSLSIVRANFTNNTAGAEADVDFSSKHRKLSDAHVFGLIPVCGGTSGLVSMSPFFVTVWRITSCAAGPLCECAQASVLARCTRTQSLWGPGTSWAATSAPS